MPEAVPQDINCEALSFTEVQESFPRQTLFLAKQVGIPDFPLYANPPVLGKLPESG